MIMNKITYSFLAVILIGCNQQSRDLNTKIIDDNLCIFTNESENYGKDSFLVEIGKIDFSKEYQSEYDISYKDVNFPVDEKNCVYIPLNKIEENVAYTISLSTINKLFSSQICILKEKNLNIIKKVEPGKSTFS